MALVLALPSPIAFNAERKRKRAHHQTASFITKDSLKRTLPSQGEPEPGALLTAALKEAVDQRPVLVAAPPPAAALEGHPAAVDQPPALVFAPLPSSEPPALAPCKLCCWTPNYHAKCERWHHPNVPCEDAHLSATIMRAACINRLPQAACFACPPEEQTA